jgi:TRAP-type C4-dicarboxylate transport system substrate-binding protein
MGKIYRLTGTTAMAVLLMAQVVSAETWRMATKMPVDSPEGKIFSRFAELVDANTNGELTIEVYPNEQLGKEDAVLEQLQAGIVQIYAEGFGYMRKWAPDLAWVSPAFVFDDYDHWVRFMDTDLVKGWFDTAAEASGVRPLGSPTAVLRGPYRVMASNKPINGLDDIAGLKIRMHADQLAIATWDHLGAEVLTLPWTETYQSISKGIVNAVNSPVSLVESMRFNEVAPYITRHDEYWQSIGFMMNEAAYQALSEELRAGLLKAYNETGDYSREILQAETDASLERIEKTGATYTVIDTKPFVEKMVGLYQEMETSGTMPAGYLAAVEASRTAK